ncbi:MAG TPA: 1-deoxy-D-xylulose-5-phosphate reductoisomerase [Spirochaetota bacterium]|nr:1-deoxy-D-xylulose-5-phosphate reductoisomerase [Spirochaetota bacterium]HPI90734.1 1-deoxy-D-xylulose-5-phosphate reductoisomerase [Spirochaetota bacterium]HPR46362.1 1-deoxy-D-xylulose-5-phosphate reductoisomerase [Spirochaetota bacterium]
MAKTITILGSTGSIGESALRVVSAHPDEFRVYALACRRNIGLLDRQIERFRPKVVAVESADPAVSASLDELREKYSGVEFLSGPEGIIEAASRDVDIVLSAIVGAAGLRPSLAALKSARRLALANKETLVMAGDLFMEMVRERGVELIPVDSEHSAIFSLLRNIGSDEVERILLTASGGSMRGFPLEELGAVTPEMALAHPTWDMGSKITIDSATLMNKGLEVIEAHHLFQAEYDRIGVVMHPESIIHSLVETVDGSMYAHMGVPDMALPIQNAFSYPEKWKNPFGKLDLGKLGGLHFYDVDPARYPALDICFTAGRTGGTMPAFLNAANEVAVETFLKKKILFTDIAEIVGRSLENHRVVQDPDIESIFEADAEARAVTQSIINKEI